MHGRYALKLPNGLCIPDEYYSFLNQVGQTAPWFFQCGRSHLALEDYNKCVTAIKTECIYVVLDFDRSY